VLAAAGGACEVDSKSGRPVAGAINLCPARLALLDAASASRSHASDSLLNDVLHELMHVLAFSEGLYASFASAKNGSGIAPGPGGGLVVRSPAVLAEGRRHYGCSALQGVPLETEGGNGTARTHWKLRALNGELMVRTRALLTHVRSRLLADASLQVGTVITGQRPALSNFTMAFLQDTGWYAPQYEQAAPLAWGSGAGCDFVTAKSCAEVGGTGEQYFCQAPSKGSGGNDSVSALCTRDKSAVGACNALPLTRPEERCYAVQPFSNWVCRDASLESEERARWGFEFGPGARCLPGGTSAPWSRVDAGGRMQYTQEQVVPGCFQVECDAAGKELFALIDGVRVACPEGQTVTLSNVKGTHDVRTAMRCMR
jgi:hypothetical protein